MTTIDPRKVQLAEKDIEDWLYENPQELRVTKWVGRQVHVPSGIIDLLGLQCIGPNGDIHIPVVVEVKNVEISAQAILQVCRYAFDVQRIVETANHRHNDYDPVHVRKVLVFKGDVNTDLLYASYGVDVELRSFDVNLSLKVSGGWHFSREKNEEDEDHIDRLMDTDQFCEFHSSWSKGEQVDL